MRRPLCLLALVVTVALWGLLSLVGLPEDPYADCDGESVYCTARVISKEYKRGVSSVTGEETLTLLVTADRVRNLSVGIQPDAGEQILIRVPVSMEGNISVLTGNEDHTAGLYAYAAAEDEAMPLGGRIAVTGTFAALQKATNHGGFDGYTYYRTLGYLFQIRMAEVTEITGAETGSVLDNVLYQVKSRLRQILSLCCLSEDDADILAAMLLGEKGWLSQETKDLYQSAGIIHILAISGLHIAILGMGCCRVLQRCKAPRIVCSVIPVLLMLLYGRMTGMSASSVRAIIMFLLHMLARAIHRTYDLLTALAVAGLLLLVSQPLYLYSAGFQFSFGAVLSIGLLTDILPSDILTVRSKRWIRQGAQRVNAARGKAENLPLPTLSLQGLAVTIGTFPINLMTYGTYPFYAVMLNALVLPLMSLLMPAGLLLLAAGLALLPIGQLMGLPVHYLLHFYLVLCEIAQELPGHTQVLGHPVRALMLLWLILMGLLVYANRQGRLPGVLVLLYIVGGTGMLTWHDIGGLRMHVIDVGQGDGILLECDGSRILIDGGSTDQSEVARYDLEPLLDWYGAGEIDLAIMTHEDEDHMNGLLELLAGQRESGIRIARLAVPDVDAAARGERYQEVLTAAAAAGTEVVYLHQGSVLRAGELTMTCLNPAAGMTSTEPNETSVVLYLTYGSFSALLTGDLEGGGEEDVLTYMASRADLFPLAADGDDATHDTVTFLKVAHHGSRGATTEAFLSAVQPQYAAISCGQDNRYGHPHAELLERLANVGAQILDTRYMGEITITTDGRRMSIHSFVQGDI